MTHSPKNDHLVMQALKFALFGLLPDEPNIEFDLIQQLTTSNCDVCSNVLLFQLWGHRRGAKFYIQIYRNFFIRSLHKNHNATIFKIYDNTTKASQIPMWVEKKFDVP